MNPLGYNLGGPQVIEQFVLKIIPDIMYDSSVRPQTAFFMEEQGARARARRGKGKGQGQGARGKGKGQGQGARARGKGKGQGGGARARARAGVAKRG